MSTLTLAVFIKNLSFWDSHREPFCVANESASFSGILTYVVINSWNPNGICQAAFVPHSWGQLDSDDNHTGWALSRYYSTLTGD